MGLGAIRVRAIGGQLILSFLLAFAAAAIADPTPVPIPREQLQQLGLGLSPLGGLGGLPGAVPVIAAEPLGQAGPPPDGPSKVQTTPLDGVTTPNISTPQTDTGILKAAPQQGLETAANPVNPERPPVFGQDPVISNPPPDPDPFSPSGIDPNGSRVPSGVTPESIAQTKPVDGVLSQFRDLEKVKADEQARINDLMTSKHEPRTLSDESEGASVLDRDFFSAGANAERPVSEGVGGSRVISTAAGGSSSLVQMVTGKPSGDEMPGATPTIPDMKPQTPSIGSTAVAAGGTTLEKKNELEPRSTSAASQEKNKEFNQLLQATNSLVAGAKAKLTGSGSAIVDMAGARPATKKGTGAFGRFFAWLSGGSKASSGTASTTGEKFKRPTRLASLFGGSVQTDKPIPTRLFFAGLIAGSIVSLLGLSAALLGVRFFILPFFRRKRDRRSRATA